ncbi:MAG TPA: NAD(P)-dependent oxidoreductase, partial [Sorangium sp.]|nr:NAD(P)-dependent oxidoreductase [Sorangium sp.]
MVVGGGQVASRKVFMLQRANARVTVIAPELCAELQ